MLRCILESEGNEAALCEPIVRAVAGVVREFEDHGLKLVEAFDSIPLLRIMSMMRELEYFSATDAPMALSIILRNKLRRILIKPEPEPVKRSKAERLAAEKAAAAADKAAAAAVRGAANARNIEIGRQIAALRDQTPNNRAFGRLRNKQFDVDTVAACEMMRVARMYGTRPEIYRSNVAWQTLAELSATCLSPAHRRDFERRIVAGEPVRAKEIAAARS